ncbi:putative HTH-type transcriptional regulator [BD1-7 clade bacterium]|uniref:Putative HTH-type transcriptional regulator n=1 Tax=BD1-7 clade bacterium TaxID=2029982 RepID=A0A5S9QSW5_9GAMM|nr:putative HTH-type transcriptional regulator [BD1-7 clade bacterium]
MQGLKSDRYQPEDPTISEQQRWLAQHQNQLLQPNDDCLIAANYAALLQQYLADNGWETDQLLEDAGLNQADLACANKHISYQQYAPFIKGAIALTNNPHLGLEFGKRLNISTHGFLGYAVMSSTTLEKAADMAGRYISIRNQLMTIQPIREANRLIIQFNANATDHSIRRFELETSLTSLYSIWKELFGNHKGIETICISETLAADRDFYAAFFSVPVEIGDVDAIVIDAQTDTLHTRITDEALSAIAEQQCRGLLESLQTASQGSVTDKVRQWLLKSPGEFMSQAAVADKLGVTSRTLNRQLAREGSGFKQITDEIKQTLASQCLLKTQWPVEDIAHMLGYSDCANFNRAFKRWFDKTPSQFRRSAA